jgi:hypothetical protein
MCRELRFWVTRWGSGVAGDEGFWGSRVVADGGRSWVVVQVLKRDIPWEMYMNAKLINSTGLQLLRRYDHRPPNVQSALLEEVPLLFSPR